MHSGWEEIKMMEQERDVAPMVKQMQLLEERINELSQSIQRLSERELKLGEQYTKTLERVSGRIDQLEKNIKEIDRFQDVTHQEYKFNRKTLTRIDELEKYIDRTIDSFFEMIEDETRLIKKMKKFGIDEETIKILTSASKE